MQLTNVVLALVVTTATLLLFGAHGVVVQTKPPSIDGTYRYRGDRSLLIVVPKGTRNPIPDVGEVVSDFAKDTQWEVKVLQGPPPLEYYHFRDTPDSNLVEVCLNDNEDNASEECFTSFACAWALSSIFNNNDDPFILSCVNTLDSADISFTVSLTSKNDQVVRMEVASFQSSDVAGLGADAGSTRVNNPDQMGGLGNYPSVGYAEIERLDSSSPSEETVPTLSSSRSTNLPYIDGNYSRGKAQGLSVSPEASTKPIRKEILHLETVPGFPQFVVGLTVDPLAFSANGSLVPVGHVLTVDGIVAEEKAEEKSEFFLCQWVIDLTLSKESLLKCANTDDRAFDELIPTQVLDSGFGKPVVVGMVNKLFESGNATQNYDTDDLMPNLGIITYERVEEEQKEFETESVLFDVRKVYESEEVSFFPNLTGVYLYENGESLVAGSTELENVDDANAQELFYMYSLETDPRFVAGTFVDADEYISSGRLIAPPPPPPPFTQEGGRRTSPWSLCIWSLVESLAFINRTTALRCIDTSDYRWVMGNVVTKSEEEDFSLQFNLLKPGPFEPTASFSLYTGEGSS